MLQLSKYQSLIIRGAVNAYSTTINSTDNRPADQEPLQQLDDLYKKLVVQVRGHDKAVLDSYKQFVVMASKELNCQLNEVREPHRFIERWTLLKSKFGNRKHMRQYEMRTYFKEFEFKHLTGSTCDTLLEYIERNLPEGVAMHVFKTRINQLPQHFNNNENENNSS